MMDVASYENGGSVVYELTSSLYQPSPRNNIHVGQVDEQEFGVDKATERMYHEQQHNDMMMMMNGGESGESDGTFVMDGLMLGGRMARLFT